MDEQSDRIKKLTHEKRELLFMKLREKGVDFQQEPSNDRSSRNTWNHIHDHQEIPLSFSQSRLWFLDRLEGKSSQYNISMAHELQGPLSTIALQRALSEIVRRHEILRTTFVVNDGVPSQIINLPEPVPIHVVDLISNGDELDGRKIQEQISTQARKLFTIEEDRLIHIALIKTGVESNILVVVMHHMISDGWSMEVFARELEILYNAYLNDEPSPLPELTSQYSDFSLIQQQWFEHEDFEYHMDYWKRKLGGRLKSLQLPLDNPRPPVQTYSGGSKSLVLSTSISRQLEALGKKERATLFSILLSAFTLLLSKYSNDDDIIIGIPIAGRINTQIEDLIGFFVNTVVLRTDLTGDPDFRTLLSRVMDGMMEAHDHQAVPFEKIVEKLNPVRDLSRTPLFQVWFNMNDLSGLNIDLPDISVQPISIPDTPAKFDLSMNVRKEDRGIELKLVYNSDLFRSDTMDTMLEQYSFLLEQITKNPEKNISQLSLVIPSMDIVPDPARKLDNIWDCAVTTRFTENAHQYPDNIAVRSREGEWNYRELHEQTNQLANLLLSSGIGKEDVISIYSQRSGYLVVAILAILKAGAAFLILDPEYPTPRLLNYLDAVKPRGFIQIFDNDPMPDVLKERMADMPFHCILGKTDGHRLDEQSNKEPDIDIRPNDLAYVAFTSGSTGEPKGIMGTHGPISHFVKWHISTFGLEISDRFSMLSGVSHDPLLRDIFTPLCLGASVNIPERSDIMTPGSLFHWMKASEITISHITPAMGQLLTWDPDPDGEKNTIDSLRYAFMGGDLLTFDVIREIKSRAPGTTIVNFYGTTETPQVMGYYILPDEVYLTKIETHARMYSGNSIPLGKGINDVQLLVMNKEMLMCGIREPGEIYVRTPYLTRGYIDDKEMTHEHFLINPFTNEHDDRLFKTGDLGWYDSQGDVNFIGRTDQQINIRGYRIEPGEIETVIMKYPGIEQAVITSMRKGSRDLQLIAYFVPNRNVDIVTYQLREFLTTILPGYLIPNIFIQVRRIPLTPNGKVDFISLPDPAPGSTESHGFIPPRDDYELRIQGVFQKILGLDQIGITDNFFELGGHSLLAARLVALISTEFEMEIPLATLFKAPTVEQLATIIRDRIQPISDSHLVPVRREGSRSPFFCMVPAPESALGYFNLGRYLDPDQPIYLLQPTALDHDLSKKTSIHEIVMTYLEEIQKIQPHGPYFLGGRCFRGVMVALEIAQHLIAQGEDVPFLVIFDAMAPVPSLSRSIRWARKRPRLYFSIQRAAYRLNSRVSRSFSNNLKKAIIKFTRLTTGKKRASALYHAFMKDTRDSYAAWPYPGNVKVYWCKENRIRTLDEVMNDWSTLVTGSLDIQEIPGNHGTMLHEPFVKDLAEIFGIDLQSHMTQTSRQNKAGGLAEGE